MRIVAFQQRFLAIALLSLATRAFAVEPSSWSVSTEPAHIVNGSPVVFRVRTSSKGKSLSGTWLGHEFTFSLDSPSGVWYAIAGASVETKPGMYAVQLKAETQDGQELTYEKDVAVARQRYPRVSLKVAGHYTAPSAEEQGKIAEDKKTKEQVFQTLTPSQEWHGLFVRPVEAQISDVFGVQRVFNGKVQSTHFGLDFRAPTGTVVHAVNEGTVILARPLFFEGNCVVIDHGQGLLSLYLHLSQFKVKEGDTVRKGQPVGLSGATGRATGPHLHLAIRWQGVYLNPQVLLQMKLP